MIAAVLTAYKPDAGFASRFAPLLSVCGAIVVSDNTPGGHKSFDLPAGFSVIHNLKNVGLGLALNVGIAEARRLGATYIVLFDQDSSPSAAFVTRMMGQLEAAMAVLGRRCCVGPTHVDDHVMNAAGGADLQAAATSTASPSGPAWQEVSCLPTSGMIFPADALAPADVFAEDFFLDLVDFEWCWRLRQSGWRFLRSPEVRMFHRLGEAERRFLGLTFHVPAPYRHYFQVRDTLRLAFRPYVPSYSKLRLIGILPLKAIVYPFILDHGLERLKWMLRGALDSLRGVRGIGAAAARLSR
jgi:rhamnosyltransferase